MDLWDPKGVSVSGGKFASTSPVHENRYNGLRDVEHPVRSLPNHLANIMAWPGLMAQNILTLQVSRVSSRCHTHAACSLPRPSKNANTYSSPEDTSITLGGEKALGLLRTGLGEGRMIGEAEGKGRATTTGEEGCDEKIIEEFVHWIGLLTHEIPAQSSSFLVYQLLTFVPRQPMAINPTNLMSSVCGMRKNFWNQESS